MAENSVLAETGGAAEAAKDEADRPVGEPGPVGKPTPPVGKPAPEVRPSATSPDLWHRISLTARLVITFVVLLVTSLLVTSLTVLGILYSHLIGQVDNELFNTSDKITAYKALTIYNRPSSLEASESVLPSNYFLRISFVNSPPHDFISNTSEENSQPSPSDLERLAELEDSGFNAPVTINSTNGKLSWRAFSMPIIDKYTKKKAGSIILALPLTNVSDTMKNTVYYFLASFAVLIGAGATAAWIFIAFALHPLKEIEKVAGLVASGSLDQRITTVEGPHTEVGSLTRSLNRMLERLQVSFAHQIQNEAKTRRFVSDASHDLRTPLSVIKGYSELYRMGAVPADEVPATMERIENQAKRMSELVESLIKLARLDEGRLVNMQICDLYKLGSYAFNDVQALDPKRPSQLLDLLGNPITDGERLNIYADPSQLTQVFNNLIGNIHRYTDPEDPMEIILGVTTDSKLCPNATPTKPQVVIEVRDHGCGVPADEHAHLFERFYRSDESRNVDTGGSGLGLSIVYAVAKVHAGMARAYETEGGGLTIQVCFPYKTAPESS